MISIPTNMDEIIHELDKEVSSADKLVLIALEDESKTWQYHHTVGRAMRNDWQLWQKDKPLHKWFYETFGIWHADDMSAMIMTSYWRHLHDKPLELEEQAKFYHNYWREQNVKPYNGDK